MSNSEIAHRGAERARKALAEALEAENERKHELESFLAEAKASEQRAIKEILELESAPLKEGDYL